MNHIKQSCIKLVIASVALMSIFNTVHATTVKVEISNLFESGGLALTPIWTGFHDGSFDTFDVGENASASLQALAEGGDISGIRADFAANGVGIDGAVFAPDGFAGAPVFEPGETSYALFDINAMSSGYFSFLSMLIPTNDGFIGNAAPDQYSLFDMMGNFVGLDILVLGSQVWDSGTELNTGFGSPFLIGGDAQDRQDENGVIGQHIGLQVLTGGLSIIGGSTPSGYSIDEAAADFTVAGFEVARIRVSQVAVSAPTASALLLLVGGVILYRRKRF